jgi:hypothetical protein
MASLIAFAGGDKGTDFSLSAPGKNLLLFLAPLLWAASAATSTFSRTLTSFSRY